MIFNNNKFWIFAILISVSFSIFWTLVHYPAIMSVDSFMILESGITGRFTRQHSALLELITMGLVRTFGPKVALLAFLQAFFYFLSGLHLARTFFPKMNRCFFLLVFFWLIYPPGWVYSVTLWKDVFFAANALFFCSYFIRFLKDHSWVHFSLSYLFLFATIASRGNALIVVPSVFVLCFFFLFFRRHKILKSTLISVALLSSVVWPSLLKKTLKIKDREFTVHIFMAQYLGWITHESRLNIAPLPEVVEFWNTALQDSNGYSKLMNRNPSVGDEWNFILDPAFNFDLLYSTMADYPLGAPGRLWDYIKRRPYVVYRFTRAYLNRLLHFNNTMPYWYHSGVWPENPRGVQEASKLPRVRAFLFHEFLHKAFRKLFQKHWIFLLLLIIALPFSLLYYFPSRNMKIFALEPSLIESFLVVSSFGISYFSSFILISAVADWRYLFLVNILGYFVLTSLIAIIINKCFSFYISRSKTRGAI